MHETTFSHAALFIHVQFLCFFFLPKITISRLSRSLLIELYFYLCHRIYLYECRNEYSMSFASNVYRQQKQFIIILLSYYSVSRKSCNTHILDGAPHSHVNTISSYTFDIQQQHRFFSLPCNEWRFFFSSAEWSQTSHKKKKNDIHKSQNSKNISHTKYSLTDSESNWSRKNIAGQ